MSENEGFHTSTILWKNQSNGRSYRITLVKDLFGFWEITREWWGVCRPGRVKQMLFATEKDALSAVECIERVRTRHGYVRSSSVVGNEKI